MRRSIIVMILILPVLLYAQIHETLPSWHWAYEYIDRIQDLGYGMQLPLINRPYTRGQAAEVIAALQQNPEAVEKAGRWIGRLADEFRPEIAALTGQDFEREAFQVGTHLIADMDNNGDETKYRGIYRTRISVPIGRHVHVYNGINFDQYLVDDPLYVGKKWRGIVGYTEQAYISGEWGRFQLKFGRDFLRWGAGRSGTLLFSDLARPLDQFTFRVSVGPFRYHYLVSSMDDMNVEEGTAQRYVSAHRVEGSFWQGCLQVAVSEAIVYGGVNRDLDWVYLNPFIFYHGAQLNKSGLGNTLGTIDIIGYPMQTWQLYGSLLLDDIQIEKTGPGDLEPGEIGFIVGTRYADLFPGSAVDAEYVHVTNRTYKTPNSWETFIHRNAPLGHPLGNDFDRWQVGLSQWVGASFRGRVEYSQTRMGEGSIYTPFDTPWFDYTVEEGYSEPFPTGIVEKRSAVKIEVRYQPSIHWGLHGFFQSMKRCNAYHVEGVSRTDAIWRIGFWWDGEVGIKL